MFVYVCGCMYVCVCESLCVSWIKKKKKTNHYNFLYFLQQAFVVIGTEYMRIPEYELYSYEDLFPVEALNSISSFIRSASLFIASSNM